jgi:hypothetical protein
VPQLAARDDVATTLRTLAIRHPESRPPRRGEAELPAIGSREVFRQAIELRIERMSGLRELLWGG